MEITMNIEKRMNERERNNMQEIKYNNLKKHVKKQERKKVMIVIKSNQ